MYYALAVDSIAFAKWDQVYLIPVATRIFWIIISTIALMYPKGVGSSLDPTPFPENIMTKYLIPTILLLLPLSAAAESVPFPNARWEIKGAETRIETLAGNEALFLHDGVAFLKDAEFHNGIIEFDIRTTGERGCVGNNSTSTSISARVRQVFSSEYEGRRRCTNAV